MTTQEIKDWQTLLKEKGYYKGAVDGIFGGGSKRGLQQFLKDNGYYKGNIDGIFGSQSNAAMTEYVKDQNASWGDKAVKAVKGDYGDNYGWSPDSSWSSKDSSVEVPKGPNLKEVYEQKEEPSIWSKIKAVISPDPTAEEAAQIAAKNEERKAAQAEARKQAEIGRQERVNSNKAGFNTDRFLDNLSTDAGAAVADAAFYGLDNLYIPGLDVKVPTHYVNFARDINGSLPVTAEAGKKRLIDHIQGNEDKGWINYKSNAEKELSEQGKLIKPLVNGSGSYTNSQLDIIKELQELSGAKGAITDKGYNEYFKKHGYKNPDGSWRKYVDAIPLTDTDDITVVERSLGQMSSDAIDPYDFNKKSVNYYEGKKTPWKRYSRSRKSYKRSMNRYMRRQNKKISEDDYKIKYNLQ